MLDALRARLRNILRRDAVAIEMEEELRQHLEQSAELLVRRGMPPDEALHAARQALGNQIVPPISPQPQDIVIRKNKPSAFFGSPLAGYLVDLQADSIIVCGTTTSGCVRATVIDGFSYNFRMSVVEECTFDRGEVSHAMNLFDLNCKYADVIPTDEAVRGLEHLPARATLAPA